MANKRTKFSIIIPTYSGKETIGYTLNSILSQSKLNKVDCELIVVIDGQNDALKTIVEGFKLRFNAAKIAFKVHQFVVNKGRFEARLEGAHLAKHSQLLFVDDRIELHKEYFDILSKIDEQNIIPSVIEIEEPSSISITIRAIRRKIYGNKWGNSFKDYYIDRNNFEKSSKGTTSVLVEKSIFLDACSKIKEETKGNTKNISDDTKILKEIMVNTKKGILRTSKLKIYYRPRTTMKQQFRHLYERGPRFVDYYLQPHTRFFYPLILFYLSFFSFIVAAILYPYLFIATLILLALITLVFGFYVGNGFTEKLRASYGLCLVGLLFGLGLLKGLIAKIFTIST